MSKSSEKVPVRVWKFGAVAPSNAKELSDIAFKSDLYYNKLVEAERWWSQQERLVQRHHVPELDALESRRDAIKEEIDSIYTAVKLERQKRYQASGDKERVPLSPELQDRLKALNAERKQLAASMKPLWKAFQKSLADAELEFAARATGLPRAQLEAASAAIREAGEAVRVAEKAKDQARLPELKATLERAKEDKERLLGNDSTKRSAENARVAEEMLAEPGWPQVWRDWKRCQREAHAKTIAARAECGLSKATYSKVEEAFKAARQAARKTYSPVKWRQIIGRGQIAVGTGNKTFALLINARKGFSIKRSRGSDLYWIATLNTGHKGNKSSTELPFKMHRMPPLDAVVVSAWIQLRRENERMRYELQMTLKHPSLAEAKRPHGTGDGGHIQLGWATHPEGVRVALLEDGSEVVVTHDLLSQHEHAASIRQAADTNAHKVKQAMRARKSPLLRAIKDEKELFGDSGMRRLRRICDGNAAERLGDKRWELWAAWKSTAFQGKKAKRGQRRNELFVTEEGAAAWLRTQGYSDPEDWLAWWLFTWVHKDTHLRQYAADVTACFQRARDAMFRREAIRISTQYKTISIDGFDIAQLKEKPELSDAGDNDKARHNLQAASPGRFREILLEVMGKRCTKRERSAEKQKREGNSVTSRKVKKTKKVAEKEGKAVARAAAAE